MVDEVGFGHGTALEAAGAQIENYSYGGAADDDKSARMVCAEEFLVGADGVQIQGDAHEVVDAELVKPAAAHTEMSLVGAQAGGEASVEPEVKGRIPYPLSLVGGERVHEIPHAVYMELVEAEDRIVREPVFRVCRAGQNALHCYAGTEGRGEPFPCVELCGGRGRRDMRVVIQRIDADAYADEPVAVFVLGIAQGGDGHQNQGQGEGI